MVKGSTARRPVTGLEAGQGGGRGLGGQQSLRFNHSQSAMIRNLPRCDLLHTEIISDQKIQEAPLISRMKKVRCNQHETTNAGKIR
jgi:hypothetical protein